MRSSPWYRKKDLFNKWLLFGFKWTAGLGKLVKIIPEWQDNETDPVPSLWTQLSAHGIGVDYLHQSSNLCICVELKCFLPAWNVKTLNSNLFGLNLLYMVIIHVHQRLFTYVALLRIKNNNKNNAWTHYTTTTQKVWLTFDHNHVDVYGTYWWLRQPLPFLQDPSDFTGWNPVIWFGSKCHQLPNCHTYRNHDS